MTPTLSVADPSATADGPAGQRHVRAHAARCRRGPPTPANPSTAFAPVSGSATPLTLLTYTGPVSIDQVTIGLKQPILANEPLRTGAYSKTLTFTLSTTTP